MKKICLKNSSYYIIGFITVICLKYYYSIASFNLLTWILNPTCQLVKMITGLQFIKETNIGYVNHEYKFIIATSCSGINFMIITFATIYFTFINRFCGNKRIRWYVFSIVFSYFFTIIINGIRIALSIFAPIYIKFISPENLHTVLGTVVFFMALLIVYNLINSYFTKTFYKSLIPLTYYLAITIFIPLVVRFYSGDFNNYLRYSMFVVIICFIIILFFYFLFEFSSLIMKFLKNVANQVLK